MERRTAMEYMATLALRLSESETVDALAPTRASLSRQRVERLRVPITNTEQSLDALLATGANEALQLRAEGMTRYKRARALVLREVLPVPQHPVKPKAIEEFKRKHGDLLPKFRSDLEQRAMGIAKADPVDQQLALDRLAEDMDRASKQVEEAISSLGIAGRVIRDDLVKLVELIPIVGFVMRVLEALTPRPRQSDPHPLAYAAFAKAELLPSETAVMDLLGPTIRTATEPNS